MLLQQSLPFLLAAVCQVKRMNQEQLRNYSAAKIIA